MSINSSTAGFMVAPMPTDPNKMDWNNHILRNAEQLQKLPTSKPVKTMVVTHPGTLHAVVVNHPDDDFVLRWNRGDKDYERKTEDAGRLYWLGQGYVVAEELDAKRAEFLAAQAKSEAEAKAKAEADAEAKRKVEAEIAAEAKRKADEAKKQLKDEIRKELMAEMKKN